MSLLRCLIDLKFSMSKIKLVTFLYSKGEGELLDSFKLGNGVMLFTFLKAPASFWMEMDYGKW